MIAGPEMICPGRALVALDERRVLPAAVAEHAHASRRPAPARHDERVTRFLGRVAGADGLDRDRLDDQAPLAHQEGEALPVRRFERRLQAALRRANGTTSAESVPS